MSDYSPLQFARDFEKFRSDLAAEPDPVDGLALMLDFWKNHSDSLPHQSNWTYLAEFIGELTGRCTKDNLENLSFDELKSIHALLKTFSDRNMDSIKDAFNTVCREYARKLFYVGDYETALKILGADTAIDSTDKDLIKGLNEFDTLYHIYSLYKETETPLKAELLNILTEWEGYRESLYQDQALCLFVEKDGRGKAARGRMKFLSARVELFRKSAPIDEVTFDNQIKTPDDPFIGVAYDALEAVRGIFNRGDFQHKAARRYHAHFNIIGGNHQFTGDSIGLAAALLTYTQLMKPEIMRHERFLSSDVAFTGSIDKEGRLMPVNGDTLTLKIERAFFSPVKYLVLPIDNHAIAQNALEQLSIKYPNRRLLLVGASHLCDLLENRNIIRSEKVCIGQLYARRVVKYTRMTKLQVPLLLCLLYVLICLIHPKAWLWFDWNPYDVRIVGAGFEVLNADSHVIWSKTFDCGDIGTETFWKLGNLDDDPENEVAITPSVMGCEKNAWLFVYDNDGDTIFSRNTVVIGEYPGDDHKNFNHWPGHIDFVETKQGIVIISRANMSMPARQYLRFWDEKGDSLGWYINSGQSGATKDNFKVVNDTCWLFGSFNNRADCACLFALNPFGCFGVSPPYNVPEIPELANVLQGNQLLYILFARSSVNLQRHEKYNVPILINRVNDSTFKFDISELCDMEHDLLYYLDISFRVFDVGIADRFAKYLESLVDFGAMSELERDTYLDSMLFKVTYWIDSGWVSEGHIRGQKTAYSR